MTRVQWVRRVLKPAVFLGALVPLGLLIQDTAQGQLGANPIEELTHRTGLTAITLLMATLAITPARRLLGMSALIGLRRMLGLLAFSYASLHLLIYVLDQSLFAGVGLSPAVIVEDIAKRPYITVGFTTFLLLLPLAVTSTNGWVRRLGGKRWQRLHRLVYVAASGAVFHFLWLVKADVRLPAIYGVVLVTLLGFRMVDGRLKRRRKTARNEATAMAVGT